MTKKPRPPRRLTTLAAAVYGFVLVSAAFGVSGVLVVIRQQTAQMDQINREAALELRASALQIHINSILGRELNALRDVSKMVANAQQSQAKEAIDTAVALEPDANWMGYASPQGDIVASAGQADAGQKDANVADQPWFKKGLRGFVADAPVLNKNGANPDALRNIDLATPVHGPNGNVAGVLGMILGFSKVHNEIATMAKALQVDVYILNDAGATILALDPDGKPHPLNPYISHLAASGMTGVVNARVEGGDSYISAIVPDTGAAEKPMLPWRLVVVLPQTKIHPEIARFNDSISTLLIGLLAILGLVTFVFVRAFIRPVTRLSEVATQIAAGDIVFPPEKQRTRETAALSAALAHLSPSKD